jgi:hypothetical protein
MLARDPVEAAEQARQFLKERPLAAYYDEILLEGLRLAQADSERGLLDAERMQRIREAVAEIMDDLSTHRDTPSAPSEIDEQPQEDSPLAKLEQAESSARGSDFSARWRTGKPVLCLPGPSLLDEAAAAIVAQLLEREGIGARAEQADALSMSKIFALEVEDVALICLCYVEHATSAQINYAIRRIRRRIPDVMVLVSLFGNIEGMKGLDGDKNTALIQKSLREVVSKIETMARTPVPEGEPEVHSRTDCKSSAPANVDVVPAK